VDGQIVSTCQSSRENDLAGEAWVRTLESYRRRGYARQVTAAWGSWLRQHGKTPYYSHRWDNLASQAVAQSLGLIQYIADAGYA
jgi:predicted GNAT family acetyltransferase